MFLLKKRHIKCYHYFYAPCYQTYNFSYKSFDALKFYPESPQFSREIQGSSVALLGLFVRGRIVMVQQAASFPSLVPLPSLPTKAVGTEGHQNNIFFFLFLFLCRNTQDLK